MPGYHPTAGLHNAARRRRAARARGELGPPPGNASIDLFAEDVLVAADLLRLPAFLYVGGHSIGGMTAMQIAWVRPETTRGVISIEGWTSHEVVEEAFESRIFDTLAPPLLRRKDEIRRRVFARWTREQVAEFRTYWKKWDGYRFLTETEVPVLELYGDRGLPRPGRTSSASRTGTTSSWSDSPALLTINLERPEEVARACTRFIERIEGRTVKPG